MSQFKVGVVGGGLVGALEACLLAKRGFQVTLFEKRHDGRGEPSYYGRSINLALSHRGIAALERLDLGWIAQERGIPMTARLIHTPDGKLKPIPYDRDGKSINSIERAGLNNLLLDKAENEYKVRVLFNHRLVDLSPDEGKLVFKVGHEEHTYEFDLILGCDGARSVVRNLLSMQMNLETSQSFIEHGYIELRIDASEDGSTFRMPENYLHIWPRGQYMMIALPNKDYSFTCTLFMPLEMLDQLKVDRQKALEFFQVNFGDSVDLIGRERIADTLTKVRSSNLISIKCKPYHLKHRVALLGDAAHAMVPFYGQGMNCGFEDCLVLDELMDDNGVTNERLVAMDGEQRKQLFESILSRYSNIRSGNGRAMSDLAMYNYIEMRDLVNTWSFMARKMLDNLLYRLMPNTWIPLYTMVTFTRIPIDECMRRRKHQDEVLMRSIRYVYGIGLIGLVAIAAQRFLKPMLRLR